MNNNNKWSIYPIYEIEKIKKKFYNTIYRVC